MKRENSNRGKDFLANVIFYTLLFILLAPTIPAWPFLWLIWWALEGHSRTSGPQARPIAPQPPAPKYHAHARNGSIIGTFDTVLDAEVCGLTAAGVRAVDLPLVLHERRRLGTYGSLREPEPARPDPPDRPPGPAGFYWRPTAYTGGAGPSSSRSARGIPAEVSQAVNREPDPEQQRLARSIFEPASLDDVAEAAAVATEDEQRLYVERLGNSCRLSLTHPGGMYPLLRIAARLPGS
jgi:hypothetical protein